MTLSPQSLHPALWLASQFARGIAPSVDTGVPVLSGQLPGGGWPTGALTELLLAQPGIGDIPVARQGMTLSAHDRPQLQAAPAIGEHTERVLTDWLGYTSEQIAALRGHGIFTAASRG